MVLYTSGATQPGVYYMHDAGSGVTDELVAVNSELVADSLQPMQAITYAARDGTEISGFLTEPRTGSVLLIKDTGRWVLGPTLLPLLLV